MKKKERDYKVIWPEYFDVKASRGEGRRVPKKLARESPTLEDVKAAAERAGFRCLAEEGRAYPGRWYKPRGRLLVYSDHPKTEIVAKIGAKLK